MKHRLRDLPEVELVSNVYDDLGRLSRKSFHNSSLPDVSFKYNIRSWPTSISSPLFSQRLHYTDGVGTPCYNGNISSVTWQSGDATVSQGYTFSYDGLSRLTDAIYGEGLSLTENRNRFNEQVTGYDKNGNILGLLRYGETSTGDYGLIDNLNLVYEGNQLKSVYDNATNHASVAGMEFTDGASLPLEYAYDLTGNLTKDLNKSIVDIEYNFLNLPCRVAFANGNRISYVYDANGTKLRTTHVIGNDTTVTDYCGNVIYENGVAKTLLTDAGFVSLSDNTYHYYLQDHQGNNRVVVDETGKVEEVNHYYPFGGTFASASSVQDYKYNGKELDRKGGLDWYDYGARHYDAVLGRWHAVDPSSEKYYGVSPYTYCKNNPVLRIDLDGKDDYTMNNIGIIQRTFVNSSSSDRLFSTKAGVDPIIINDKNLLLKIVSMQNDKKNQSRKFYTSTENLADAAAVFKFGADNTSVEWKLDLYSDEGNKTAIIGTSHKENSVFNDVQKELNVQGEKIVDLHSHPNNDKASDNDMRLLKAKTGAIYYKVEKSLFFYNNKNSHIGNESYEINTSKELLEKLNEKIKKQ